MDVVDNSILSSFLQLTNRFAESSEIERISSLADLWQKHGSLISRLMQLETLEHATSSDFYNALLRKMRLINGTMAEGLDASKAANGNLLEICKFYALHLEYLRKEQGEMLKKFLEQMAKDTHFNSDALLNLFGYFDKLYEDDCADDWWSILKQEEEFIGLSTPTSKRANVSMFVTPTASSRRMRTITSSARRSPIVDAIDSPTMKFMRLERELKQVKKKMLECQGKLEDTDADNNALDKENRELKMIIAELRSSITADRNSVQLAEDREEEVKMELKTKEEENQKLRNELNGAMQNVRSFLRQIEGADKEKLAMDAKLVTLTKDKENLLREVRDIRETNESDYNKWQQRENELASQLATLQEESRNAILELSSLKSSDSEMRSEIERLKSAIRSMEIENGRLEQDKGLLSERIDAMTQSNAESIQQERADREKALKAEAERFKMAEMTITRLERELKEEKKEKEQLRSLMESLNQKSLNIDSANHSTKEGYLNAKSCLEAAKGKIELLEVELNAKDGVIEALNAQIDQVGSMLITERSIRDNMLEQQRTESEMFKNLKTARDQVSADLKATEEKLKESEKSISHMKEAHQREIEELKKFAEERELKNGELLNSLNLMESDKTEAIIDAVYWKARSSTGNSESFARGGNRSSLEKEVDSELINDENAKPTVSETPKKSVAFVIENESEKRSTMPPGFKLDSSQRSSQTSLNRASLTADDTFDRMSLKRSSTRSECSVAPNPASFKQPFTPVSKDRIDELKARNKMVPPALRSSYVTEVGSVPSPSADENNMKKMTGKRRSSLASLKNMLHIAKK